MKCFNCNQEIPEGAKFCKFCGAKMSQPAVKKAPDTKSCPKCGAQLPVTSKFCGMCGASLVNTAPKADESGDNGVDVHSNYITWHVLPGQLALKIDERDIEAYKTIKGVYITPGTKALFFVSGKFVAALESGTYPFTEHRNDAREINDNERSETKKENKVIGFFKNIARHVSNGISALFGNSNPERAHRDYTGNRVFYTVVLIRSAEFPLVFDFDKLTTADLPTDIGLHIRCKITNLNAFFEEQLVDKRMLTIQEFADSLSVCVRNVIAQKVATMPSESIANTPELSAELLTALQESVSGIYSYMTVSHIISLTVKQQELEQLRALKNELYVAEKELQHLQQRYDYMNRLQSVENEQTLREARTRVDFEALMDEIDNDSLLNADKKRQFVEMLEAQAELRRATTAVEQQSALNKLEQTSLLSEEELSILKREITQRTKLSEMSDAQALALATMRNERELDREKLVWEMEIGNQRIDLEMARESKKLDHDIDMGNRKLDNELEQDDKRFDHDLKQKERMAEFDDNRRQSQMNFEQQQMQHQMDLLRQAQALREEREQAQHKRDMESQQMQNAHELNMETLHANTEVEKHKINATMSFEQIMASNPDISPEAARALAKKFEAEAAAAQSNNAAAQTEMISQIMQQHNNDLKDIVMQQMNLNRDIVTAQSMASAATLDNKQKELDRVHRDTQHNEDRYVDVMRSTLSAASGVRIGGNNNNNNNANGGNKDNGKDGIVCPNCGKKHPDGTLFCDECGATL